MKELEGIARGRNNLKNDKVLKQKQWLLKNRMTRENKNFGILKLEVGAFSENRKMPHFLELIQRPSLELQEREQIKQAYKALNRVNGLEEICIK
jgi:hypothetical protein